MSSRFIHVTGYVRISFFKVEQYSIIQTPHFVYLFISQWTFGSVALGGLWIVLLWTLAYTLFNPFGYIPRNGNVIGGFPDSFVSKESACNAGDTGSVPGSGRSSGGGHGNPLQYYYLENPMDREACQITVPRIAKSRTQLKRLSMHAPMYRTVINVVFSNIICSSIKKPSTCE